MRHTVHHSRRSLPMVLGCLFTVAGSSFAQEVTSSPELPSVVVSQLAVIQQRLDQGEVDAELILLQKHALAQLQELRPQVSEAPPATASASVGSTRQQPEGPSSVDGSTSDNGTDPQRDSSASAPAEPSQSGSVNSLPAAAGVESPGQRQVWADSVWGHLPPRQRRELMQNFSEQFLPGYEDQVSSYFRRLATFHLDAVNAEDE